MSHLRTAIPLVLPNNCTWDHVTGRYNKDPDDQRRTLVPQENTLDELRRVKGPVCVVAVAGPCRNGKSFILGETFGHSEVFALGHTMKPETMGIWMWIVPEKFRDENGREFTIVLLDSEGIDSVESEASNDHRIFTLSCLLSSILLYNSSGVPKMKDLNDLECVTHISERIQFMAGTKNKENEAHHASKVLPFFIWLLRDVTLGIPGGHASFKDYLLKEILDANNRHQSDIARKAAKNIVGYFSGFDALEFPAPSYEPSVVQNMSDPSVRPKINPQFLSTIERFRTQVLIPLLCPKRSTNEGEWVTGEGLAALVQLFTQALNTPGSVPNFQNSWDIFVQTTCAEAVKASIEMYKVEMASRVENQIPCNSDVLRSAHEEVMQLCVHKFLTETASLSANSVRKFQEELEGNAASIFEKYIEVNRGRTAAGCRDLLKKLKNDILQPVLTRLRGPDATTMEYKDVVEAYDTMENRYKSEARGAKDVIHAVFMDFLPEFREEMKQNMDVLQRMKDYDADIENQKAMNAAIEKVQQENMERIAELEAEMKGKEREFVVMSNKIEADKTKLQEEFARKERENRDQMNNMMKAHQDQMKESRDHYQKQQENLQTRLDGIEKALKDKNQEIANLQGTIGERKSRSIPSLLWDAGVKIVGKAVDKCCIS